MNHTKPLEWHYENGPDPICNHCGGQVYSFKEGMICNGCGRSADHDPPISEGRADD